MKNEIETELKKIGYDQLEKSRQYFLSLTLNKSPYTFNRIKFICQRLSFYCVRTVLDSRDKTKMNTITNELLRGYVSTKNKNDANKVLLSYKSKITKACGINDITIEYI